MRNFLFTLTIVSMMIVTRGSDNGQTITTTNLESSKTTVEVTDYQNWYKEINQLERRVQNSDGYNGISCRCSRRSRTKGADTNRLRLIKTQEVEIVPAQVIVFNTEDNTTINYAAKWKRQVRLGGRKSPVNHYAPGHKCECGKNCKCPPYVCKAGHCKSNYAVVFGVDWCSVCPRMWPIVKRLRKQGYIVYYIDTGKHRGIVDKFDLHVWPTTFVIENGKVKARFNGLTSVREISRYLKTREQQGIKPKKKAKR